MTDLVCDTCKKGAINLDHAFMTKQYSCDRCLGITPPARDLRDQPSPYSEALATAQADAARCARALEATTAELANLRAAVRAYRLATRARIIHQLAFTADDWDDGPEGEALHEAEDLADIATRGAHVARGLGLEPRVAFLSFSNFGYPVSERAVKMAHATEVLDRRGAPLGARRPRRRHPRGQPGRGAEPVPRGGRRSLL